MDSTAKAPSRSVGEVLVLCYHAVSETWPAVLAVTPEQLERQLRTLLGQGFRPLTFLDALQSLGSGERALVVTFDDGYRSVFDFARPILDRLGVPGTVFVPTRHIGRRPARGWDGTSIWRRTSWESELSLASWEELADLAAGGWEIGSHSREHPHLPSLDDTALAAELEGSRRECEERLGAPCLSLAYPYGEVDGRVRDAAASAGYVGAVCLSRRLPPRSAPVDPLLWPRLTINRGETMPRLLTKVWLFRHSRWGWNAVQAARERAQTTGADRRSRSPGGGSTIG